MGYEPGAWAYSPSSTASQEDYDRGFALVLDALALPPLGTESITDGTDCQVSEKQNGQRSSSDEGILSCPAQDSPLVLDLKASEIQAAPTADHSREGHQPASPTSSLGPSDGLSDDEFEPEEFPDDIGVVVRVPDLSARFGKLRF
jgi:hypothetical protein